MLAIGTVYTADPLSLLRDILPNPYDGAATTGTIVGIHGLSHTLGGNLAMRWCLLY